MKPTTRIFIIMLLLTAATAFAAPDYSELRDAVKDYGSVIAQLSGQTWNVIDAAGTLKVIDDWTAANNKLADTFQTFTSKNPGITQGAMPPEVEVLTGKIARVGKAFPDLQTNVRSLVTRLAPNPAFAPAMQKLGDSQDRLDHLWAPSPQAEAK